MSVSVYDVNNFLKSDTTLQTLAGKAMNFFPVVGYASEAPPFVIYYYTPSIPNVEAFWSRNDNIRYSIYDSDADRLFRIVDRIIYLLGRGDTVGDEDGIISSNYYFKSASLVSSVLMEPLEKEGWYQMDLDFRLFTISHQ